MANKAMVTRSPVESSISSSRSSGSAVTSWAKSSNRSVSPLIADSTTTTRWPSLWPPQRVGHADGSARRADGRPAIFLNNQRHVIQDPFAKSRTTNFVASRGGTVQALSIRFGKRRPALIGSCRTVTKAKNPGALPHGHDARCPDRRRPRSDGDPMLAKSFKQRPDQITIDRFDTSPWPRRLSRIRPRLAVRHAHKQNHFSSVPPAPPYRLSTKIRTGQSRRPSTASSPATMPSPRWTSLCETTTPDIFNRQRGGPENGPALSPKPETIGGLCPAS